MLQSWNKVWNNLYLIFKAIFKINLFMSKTLYNIIIGHLQVLLENIRMYTSNYANQVMVTLPNLIFFFQIVLTILDLLNFYMNFRIGLSISSRKLAGILICIALIIDILTIFSVFSVNMIISPQSQVSFNFSQQ